jgi:hypothetical protein
VVLSLLIALTVAARLPLLHESLWLDEVASARVVTQPTLPKMLTQIRREESTPPAWYAIAWATRQVAGLSSNDVAYLRWLSILFSAAATALTFVYAGRLLSLPGAALAGAVTALGPAFVEHGAELRAYALLTLVSIAFAILLERSVALPNKPRLAALSGVVMLGSLTHYFFLLTLLAGLSWLWLWRPNSVSRRPITAAVGAGLLPFFVWSPVLLHQYRHRLYAFIGSFNTQSVLYSYARVFGVFGANGALYAAGRLTVLILVLAGVWLLVRKPREISFVSKASGLLCAELAVLPVAAAAVLWAFGEPIFIERNLLGSGPFAAIAIAAALSSLPRRFSFAAIAVMASVLFWACATMELTWGRAPYQGIANVLVRDGWQPADNLIQFGPAPLGILGPVAWYLPRSAVPVPLPRGTRSWTKSVFVVSYDRFTGPRWLQEHRSQVLTVNTFPAYDHSPLGPRASTPIIVARLRGSRGFFGDAEKHGGRIYALDEGQATSYA